MPERIGMHTAKVAEEFGDSPRQALQPNRSFRPCTHLGIAALSAAEPASTFLRCIPPVYGPANLTVDGVINILRPNPKRFTARFALLLDSQIGIAFLMRDDANSKAS